MRGPPLPFVAVAVALACGLLLGCGSGGGPPNAWSQTGSTVRASWTVPSTSVVNLQLERAGTVSGCKTTSRGKSEYGTYLIIGGEPAVFFRIGKALQPGARARTVCQVSGTVAEVSLGAEPFKHVKRAS